MPAIRVRTGSFVHSFSHNMTFHQPVVVRLPPGTAQVSKFYSFICNGGAKHFAGAKLGMFEAEAVSGGDGSTEEEWRKLDEGEYVLAMLTKSSSGYDHHYNVYPLVDDFSVPMTNKKRRTFQDM